jgi:hypothetical protein
VQVTDDSPQHIWYVAGADLIAVPSESTRVALVSYGKAANLPPVRFEALPYPVSSRLNVALSAAEYEQRRRQIEATGDTDIQLAIPISGAAVGLAYFRRLIDELYRASNRFRFQVVAKSSAYTHSFLHDLAQRPCVTLHTADIDRDVVEKYLQLYQTTNVSLEVTKPSEQAFKALIPPGHRGGALLLFSQPVGRQEYDNLNFLGRHHLLPTGAQQRQLWASARTGSEQGTQQSEVQHWRGVRLPEDAVSAAHYIWWSLQQGVFSQMLDATLTPQPDDLHPKELASDGVRQFWEVVSGLL